MEKRRDGSRALKPSWVGDGGTVLGPSAQAPRSVFPIMVKRPADNPLSFDSDVVVSTHQSDAFSLFPSSIVQVMFFFLSCRDNHSL